MANRSDRRVVKPHHPLYLSGRADDSLPTRRYSSWPERCAPQGRRYGCSLTPQSPFHPSLLRKSGSGTFNEMRGTGTCLPLTEESRYGVVVQVQKILIDLIHHPVRSIKGSFAISFLMSRPPLLARRGNARPDDSFTPS